MKKAALILTLIFLLGATLSAQEQKPTIAVSPFNNITGNKSLDYVAFQISEYLTTAYGAFQDITLVERSNLVAILKEQQLQLSGITESDKAVRIGEILNAQYMVLGSYSAQNETLRVSARVTHVENGEVITAKAVQGDKENIFPLLKNLFYQLVGGMKASGTDDFTDWQITVPIEARVTSLEDQGEEVSRQFAKALDASFRKNDSEALSLLQETISGSNLNYANYAGAAEQYLETYKKVQKIESETFFTRMLERQIDTNKKLLAEAEKLTVYRNTLKILFNRINQLLEPSVLHLEVGNSYEFSEGTVSMRITPPSELRTSVSGSFKDRFWELISQQDILGASPDGTRLMYKKMPEINSLMPLFKITSLFDFSITAEIDYAVQFLSPSGEVIYELVPASPAVPFSISDGKIAWSHTPAEIYNEQTPRPGWSFRNGTVEIQARELQNLSDVRVTLKPDTFRIRSSFPMEQDQIWKSLIMHMYRQKYVKVASGNQDPCPQVKESVVTDYMLTLPEYNVGQVPLLVNKRPLARFADLTGVVYWADSSHTLVEGKWRGAITGNSPTVRGELTSESVLYFPIKSSPNNLHNLGIDSASFTVANEGKAKTIDFKVGPAMSLHYEDRAVYRIMETEEALFGTGTRGTYRYDPHNGEIMWHSIYGGGALTHDETRVFTTSNSNQGTGCLDQKTGELLWKNAEVRGFDIIENGNQLFVAVSSSRTYYIKCLEKETGSVLWTLNNGARSIELVNDTIVSEDGFVNRTTGEFEERISSRLDAADIQVGDGKVFFTGNRGTYSYNPVSHEQLWSNRKDGSALIFEDDRVYVTEPGNTVCMDAGSGEILWENEEYGGYRIALMDDTLYTIENEICALDKSSGKTVWKGNFEGREIIATDRLIYFSDNEDELWALDPNYFFQDRFDIPTPISNQSNAQQIRNSTYGTIGKIEQDWYKISISPDEVPTELTLETSGNVVMNIEVKNESNHSLGFDDRGGYGEHAKLKLGIFEAQDLYAKLTADSSSASGSYQLSVDQSPINGDAFEPDNIWQEAKDYSGEREQRNFFARYDLDWVRLSVEKGGTYAFTTYGDADTYGTLYQVDPQGRNELRRIAYDDRDGDNNNFEITEELLPGTIYLLKINPDYNTYRSDDAKIRGKEYILSITERE